MENMKYAEELLREFLVFRGFTATLKSFETELSTDIGMGFHVDKIIDLVFSVYIPKFESDKLMSILQFLKQCFFNPQDSHLNSTMIKLHVSTLKYYIVYSVQKNRQDKVVEFFSKYGNEMLQTSEDWTQWFAIPYVKNPGLDPRFRIYFSNEWLDALLVSFRNFLSQVFSPDRLPTLLRVTLEQINIKALKREIERLNSEAYQTRQILQAKEAELSQLKRFVPVATLGVKLSELKVDTEAEASSLFQEKPSQGPELSKEISGSNFSSFSNSSEEEGGENQASHDGAQLSTSETYILGKNLEDYGSLSSDSQKISSLTMESSKANLLESDLDSEEELSDVKTEFQEIFSGHTSPIARCRFSAAGTNVASASIDGTVRIWTYDPSASASRNATIYCGSETMSLDWEYKFDRLLLIGTAEAGIKAWNVDAKRVVCDLNTGTNFPYVLDLKCSPVDSLFVSAAASKRRNNDGTSSIGFASLTTWNMKTWKPMTVFPLGEDPPAITSVCFNHNGKILAASATDGMIHMFDMSAGLPITGWPAHDSAVSCIRFGPDEASVFSLGTDGKIFEWSLHNQGQVLWSKDSSSYVFDANTKLPRHEMALDVKGRRLLVTSNTSRAPLYQFQGRSKGQKTPSHGGAITSVDWHPTSEMFLTGSADHSVHVTSIS